MSCFLRFLLFLLEYIVYIYFDMNIYNQLASTEWTMWLFALDFAVGTSSDKVTNHALSILPFPLITKTLLFVSSLATTSP